MHGDGYSEEQYAAALPELLQLLRREAPKAKIILATTTDVRKPNNLEIVLPKTARLQTRNELVSAFAKREHLLVNDLYSVIKDHPEFHAQDGVHCNEKGSAALAAQVVAAIANELP
jgi:lysophospholipase L1-like esterase